MLGQVKTAIDNPVVLESEPYVVSFTQHGDRLEMWRSYGRDGGCSIEFDLNTLVQVLADTNSSGGSRFSPTESEYGQMVDGNMLLQSQMQRIVYGDDEGRRHFAALLDKCKRGSLAPSQDLIYSFSSFVKHQDFRSEEEVRLLIQSPSCMNSKVSVREARGHLVPYRTVTFPHIAVKSITIGPSPYGERTKKALNRFLYSGRGEWCHVRVRTSSVPYLA